MTIIDTSPLVALCDPRDSYHRAALKHLSRLAPGGLGICEAIVIESCFHLPHHSQRQRLRAVLDEFDIDPLATQGTDFWNDVWAWLLKYADHEPDWADGCIAVLCGREDRLKVWTYDAEFRTTWRKPDGKTIPMAVRL